MTAPPRSFRFEFPAPPNLNDRKLQGRSQSRAKKQYYAELDVLQAAGRLPAPPAIPLVFVVATASLHLKNTMDDDNASHRVKWCQDWMKKRGYITDDRKPWYRMVNTPEQVTDRSGRPPVAIITITELVDGGAVQ